MGLIQSENLQKEQNDIPFEGSVQAKFIESNVDLDTGLAEPGGLVYGKFPNGETTNKPKAE